MKKIITDAVKLYFRPLATAYDRYNRLDNRTRMMIFCTIFLLCFIAASYVLGLIGVTAGEMTFSAFICIVIFLAMRNNDKQN